MNCNKIEGGNAYDLLKFVMALFIVAIHTKCYQDPIANQLLKPFLGVAVPVFFILSSMFYFIKLRRNVNKWEHLKSFLSRLGLLYIFWFILNIVFIQHEHRYFIHGGIFDIYRLCKDCLFKYTFSGSWFLSALALSIFAYTMLHNKKILSIGLFLFSFFGLFYIHEIEFFPFSMRNFYEWWQHNIRDEVTLSVLEALPWVGMGYYLSSEKIQDVLINSRNNRNIFNVLLYCLFFVSFFCLLNSNFGYKFLELPIRIMMAIILVLFVGCSNLSSRPEYLTLRKMSVIFYLFHFVAIRILSLFSVYVLHIPSLQAKIGIWGYYCLVLISCFVVSICILHLQKNKRFYWLKYAY